MKKVVKTFIIILLLTLSITGCDSKKSIKNDNIDNNVVIENQSINNINFKDFLVIFKKNISTIYFDIENANDIDSSYTKVKCYLYDKTNNLIASFEEDISNLKTKEVRTISEKFDVDLTETQKVEYILE